MALVPVWKSVTSEPSPESHDRAEERDPPRFAQVPVATARTMSPATIGTHMGG